MKKSLFLLVLMFFIISFSKASHVIGGDFQINMTSQTPTGGNYHVKLRVYRDDVNGIVMPSTVAYNVFQVGTNIPVFGSNQTLNQTSIGLVPLGDPCYTPDPNVVRIEEGIFESTTDIFIPNFGPGYYVSASISARNSLAINVPVGGTMTWFAMIPDPSIGLNSTPDFGNYPNDAYFCTSGPKQFQYPITDADGDSLAYSLVEPLASSSTTAGPGSGAYPYYPSLGWQAGYSLANIVGGATPMSINQTTGTITAWPSVQGFFTFAIRVEEFRDTTGTGVKVKIGEVRRDVQYISLNCTSGSPPSFLNVVPTMGQTIQIPYNKLYCKDLIFNDVNVGDTLYIEMISTIFDSGAYVPTMTPDVNGDYHYYYNGGGNPWVWNDSVVIPPNQYDTAVGADWNITTVANRFCWTPQCGQIGEIYPFEVSAYSLGCDGKSQDSILFNIEVTPPVYDFKNPGDVETPFGEEFCRNLVFHDTSIVDMLHIDISSEIFSMGAEYPSLDNNYGYTNYVYPSPDDVITTGVPNGAANTVNVASRFCWTPDCENIGQTYKVQAVLSSIDCPPAVQDTIDFNITVTPPFDSLDVIPNVITPNGDGINDVYTLGYVNNKGQRVGGISNPCHDEIKVQIFNRWGILIYENNDYPEFQWDGKNKNGNDVPAGTYFVLIHGTYGNETVTLDQRTVTIMR